jgi:nitroreductase
MIHRVADYRVPLGGFLQIGTACLYCRTMQSTPPNDAASLLLRTMQTRQHIAPKRLVTPGPDEHAQDWILQAAESAPDHGRLQPWRLIEIPPARRADLGTAFTQALLLRDPHASAEQQEAAFDKALRAPFLLLAVLRCAGPDDTVPDNERLLSLGCAMQNMLLMAEALQLGAGITSGQALQTEPIRHLFSLTPHEKAQCFLGFGTVASRKPARVRAPYATFFDRL